MGLGSDRGCLLPIRCLEWPNPRLYAYSKTKVLQMRFRPGSSRDSLGATYSDNRDLECGQHGVLLSCRDECGCQSACERGVRDYGVLHTGGDVDNAHGLPRKYFDN